MNESNDGESKKRESAPRFVEWGRRIDRMFLITGMILFFAFAMTSIMLDRSNKALHKIQQEQLEIATRQIVSLEKLGNSSQEYIKSLEEQVASKENVISAMKAKDEIQSRLIEQLEKEINK